MSQFAMVGYESYGKHSSQHPHHDMPPTTLVISPPESFADSRAGGDIGLLRDVQEESNYDSCSSSLSNPLVTFKSSLAPNLVYRLDDDDDGQHGSTSPGLSHAEYIAYTSFMTMAESYQAPELILISPDSGYKSAVGIHKNLLVAHSRSLYQLLSTTDQPQIIVLPDYSQKIIRLAVQLLYTGQVLFTEMDDAQLVISALGQLGIQIPLTRLSMFEVEFTYPTNAANKDLDTATNSGSSPSSFINTGSGERTFMDQDVYASQPGEPTVMDHDAHDSQLGEPPVMDHDAPDSQPAEPPVMDHYIGHCQLGGPPVMDHYKGHCQLGEPAVMDHSNTEDHSQLGVLTAMDRNTNVVQLGEQTLMDQETDESQLGAQPVMDHNKHDSQLGVLTAMDHDTSDSQLGKQPVMDHHIDDSQIVGPPPLNQQQTETEFRASNLSGEQATTSSLNGSYSPTSNDQVLFTPSDRRVVLKRNLADGSKVFVVDPKEPADDNQVPSSQKDSPRDPLESTKPGRITDFLKQEQPDTASTVINDHDFKQLLASGKIRIYNVSIIRKAVNSTLDTDKQNGGETESHAPSPPTSDASHQVAIPPARPYGTGTTFVQNCEDRSNRMPATQNEREQEKSGGVHPIIKNIKESISRDVKPDISTLNKRIAEAATAVNPAFQSIQCSKPGPRSAVGRAKPERRISGDITLLTTVTKVAETSYGQKQAPLFTKPGGLGSPSQHTAGGGPGLGPSWKDLFNKAAATETPPVHSLVEKKRRLADNSVANATPTVVVGSRNIPVPGGAKVDIFHDFQSPKRRSYRIVCGGGDNGEGNMATEEKRDETGCTTDNGQQVASSSTSGAAGAPKPVDYRKIFKREGAAGKRGKGRGKAKPRVVVRQPSPTL